MLQIADVVLVERKGIPQDRSRILDGIALGQLSPCRGREGQEQDTAQSDQSGLEMLLGQGGTPVLTGLWHSRMIP